MDWWVPIRDGTRGNCWRSVLHGTLPYLLEGEPEVGLPSSSERNSGQLNVLKPIGLSELTSSVPEVSQSRFPIGHTR